MRFNLSTTRRKLLSVVLLHLILTTNPVSGDQKTCYFPNSISSSGSPCDPSVAVSACCGPGFVCLSNGLCQPGPDTHKTYKYQYYRSSCTDRSWNSTACPQYCLTAEDDLNSGQGLQECSSDNFCCGRGGDCCSSSDAIFHIESGDLVTTIPLASATKGTTAATATSSSSSSNGKGGSDSGSNTVPIALGVSLGIAALIIIVCFRILLLLRRKRQRKRAMENGGHAPSLPGPYEMNGMNGPEEKYAFQQINGLSHKGQTWTPMNPQAGPAELEHVPRHEMALGTETAAQKTPIRTYEMEG